MAAPGQGSVGARVRPGAARGRRRGSGALAAASSGATAACAGTRATRAPSSFCPRRSARARIRSPRPTGDTAGLPGRIGTRPGTGSVASCRTCSTSSTAFCTPFGASGAGATGGGVSASTRGRCCRRSTRGTGPATDRGRRVSTTTTGRAGSGGGA